MQPGIAGVSPAERTSTVPSPENRDAAETVGGEGAAPVFGTGSAMRFYILDGIWCDTCANVSRTLDRRGLRDFERRALFQMNATDSSRLMDAPDASKLDVHRAMFYDEGQGRMEESRPYALPSNEWLAAVKRQVHSRA